MLTAGFIAIATALVIAMFVTKNSMLGFPSAIFWALLGGQAYTQSTATWDVYFIFAFACLLGMTTFCAFAAYGLREKRDTLGEESMEKGNGGLLDEKPAESFYDNDGLPDLDKDTLRPRIQRRSRPKRRKGEFES